MCVTVNLQGQRAPALRAHQFGTLLSDQCTGHGAFDTGLQASNKTTCLMSSYKCFNNAYTWWFVFSLIATQVLINVALFMETQR